MKAWVLILTGSLLACEVLPAPTPPKPEPTPCERACAHWERLGCEVAEPDEEGNSCTFICEETQKGGLIDLKPELAEESQSCP